MWADGILLDTDLEIKNPLFQFFEVLTLGMHKTDNRKTTNRKSPFVCIDMPAWESHDRGAMEKSQVAGLHCILSFRTTCSTALGLLEKDVTQ